MATTAVGIVAGTVTADRDNSVAIEALSPVPNKVQDLPIGYISVNPAPTLTYKNSGLTLRGRGESTLNSNNAYGTYMLRAGILIRCGVNGMQALSFRQFENPPIRGLVLPAGQVGWAFPAGSESRNQPVMPQRILPGQQIPQTGEFMRAFSAVPFGAGQREFTLQPNHGILPGMKVWATDGPKFNECEGEFATVLKSTAQTITLDRTLIRKYTQGTFVKGEWPYAIALSDIEIRGQLGTMVLQQCCDIQLHDIYIHPVDGSNGNDALGVHGCGRVTARYCRFPGIELTSGHEAEFSFCKAGKVKGEQGQIYTTFRKCQFDILDANIGNCWYWKLFDVDCSEFLGIYDYWQVDDCTCTGTTYIRGESCQVNRLKSTGTVYVQHRGFDGNHSGSGRNVEINGIDCHWLELLPGTKGRITKCTGQIICRDPDTRLEWTVDGRPI